MNYKVNWLGSVELSMRLHWILDVIWADFERFQWDSTKVSVLIKRTCVPTDEDLIGKYDNESEFEDSGDEERGIDALKGTLLNHH